jgi:predicted metal-binding protein
MNHQELETVFNRHSCTDYKWINPKEIVTAQWVRIKCMYGCGDYGKIATCPPNVPSVSECRQFFDEYEHSVIFHYEKAVDKPEDRFQWAREINLSLIDLEKDVFLSGYQKAFVLLIDSCSLCKECTGVLSECKNPKTARPTPEAMAIDVYSTVRKYNYPIQVLDDYSKTMNRYAFLLIE